MPKPHYYNPLNRVHGTQKITSPKCINFMGSFIQSFNPFNKLFPGLNCVCINKKSQHLILRLIIKEGKIKKSANMSSVSPK